MSNEVNVDAERERFEGTLSGGLELAYDHGRDCYLGSHIEARWQGWLAKAHDRMEELVEARRPLADMTIERDMLVSIKIALEEKIDRCEALLNYTDEGRRASAQATLSDVHLHLGKRPDDLEYRVGRLELRPGDVLVVKTEAQPTMAQLKQMKQQLDAVVTGTRCLVLANGEDLSVLSREDIDRRSQPDGVAS